MWWTRFLVMLEGRIRDAAREAAFRATHPTRRARPIRGALSSAISAAIDRGTEFLIRHQSRDGAWRGFLLLPGTSTEWITAHVAFAVEDVPELDEACARAAGYLATKRSADLGWAWNHRATVDVDSVANALLVLDRFGRPFPPRSLPWLLEVQAEDGGFPTNPDSPAGPRTLGWGAAHPDVTALVVELLTRVDPGGEPVRRARAWLSDQLMRGVLPSYWWHGWAYGIWAQSRIGLTAPQTTTWARELLSKSTEVPDLAMLLAALATLEPRDDAVSTAADRLIRAQRSDGSWRCRMCLRLTSMLHYEAGPHLHGPVYADKRRTFSTAHSVAALHRVRASLGA